MKEQFPAKHLTSPDNRMFNNPDRTAEADRRLEVLDEVVRGYQEEFPFIKGATVFGSTMHGGAHEKSDIDTFVFVDPEEVEKELGGRMLDAYDYSEMARVVEHDLLSRIGAESGEQSSGRRNDVQMFLVNDEIIDGSVAAFEATAQASAAYREKVEKLRDDYWNGDNADETFEDYAKRHADIDPYEEPELAMMEWGVSALFHPGVGDTAALAKDRQAVLDRLAQSPVAEEAWQDIAFRVQSFEGDMHSEEAKFPQTFAEAQKAFGHAA